MIFRKRERRPPDRVRNHTRALVLSGGGARGAYEAGVIGYIWRLLGRHFKDHPPFKILCGTSVGAINAISLAAHAHDPATQGEVLIGHWQGLRGNQILRLSARSLIQFSRWMISSVFPRLARVLAIERGSLLDTRPLEEFVRSAIHWPQVQKNLDGGWIEAVSISATELSSGRTKVFVATPRHQLPSWTTNRMILADRCVIRPEHVLASASIPILFPAVPIGGIYHCDGGLHQNTPLSPALRLGADRVLVIGIRRSEEGQRPKPGEVYPTPVFLAGKILDAMLLDRIDYDIDRLNLVNDLLEAGERSFGAEFKTAIDEVVARRRGTSYRKVKCLYIRPSRDIGEIALACIKAGEIDARGVTRRLIRRVASAESGYAADLMSYVLFDRSYANKLIALGFEDARRQREEILDFFDDRDLGGPVLVSETSVDDFRFEEEERKASEAPLAAQDPPAEPAAPKPAQK